jgi:tRNA(Met) cytidine acetyltransferase
MDLAALAGQLREEAERTDERRLVVLAGDRDRGYDAVETILDAASIESGSISLVGPVDRLGCERFDPKAADELLGTTREAVVIDLHDSCRPNALGQTIGAVDGGGLVMVLTPSLDSWPQRRDEFDQGLAVPPFAIDDVTGQFRARFVETLRCHDGIAIVDLDVKSILDDGLVDPAPRLDSDEQPTLPSQHTFRQAAYERCRTPDQVAAVRSLEALRDPNQAIVVESDRGRGKSSALGIAAGSLAAEGLSVLVTAPAYRNTAELLARAREVLDDLGLWMPQDGDPSDRIEATGQGRIRFVEPDRAAEIVEADTGTESPGHVTPDAETDRPDVVIVDEAAGLPVRRLTSLLAIDRVAFATTTYGYEGAGRGFSVRFRDRLAEGQHELTDVRLDEPIRYAAGDPVETWLFDALLLDARPVVDPVVEDVTPGAATYSAIDPAVLRQDDHRLRELFGLLVLAHYRTEPNDLARLLDAPNIAVRALLANGHVVGVALLAREGGLPAELRREMFDGGRVRGNMLPDVLTSQLRDETAAIPVGARVLRIATHPAIRSRGLGSLLLSRVRSEAAEGIDEWTAAPRPEETPPSLAADEESIHPAGTTAAASDGLDWLGVGYGATEELLDFWRRAEYRTIHISTTRNDTSGEYSVLMLLPLSAAGTHLHDRTARRFVRRIRAVCADPLDDADPDLLSAALAATASAAAPGPDLTDWEWTVVASAAYGPGLADVSPSAFGRLVLRHLIDPATPDVLTADEERLLVYKALQAHNWPRVREERGFSASGPCMRAFGTACKPLVDLYGPQRAHEIRDRFRREE